MCGSHPHLTTSYRGLSHATHCVRGGPPRDPGKAIMSPTAPQVSVVSSPCSPLASPAAHQVWGKSWFRGRHTHQSAPHVVSGSLSDCVFTSALALSLSHVACEGRHVSCLCVTQQTHCPSLPSGYMGISIYKTSLLIYHLLKGNLVASKFR